MQMAETCGHRVSYGSLLAGAHGHSGEGLRVRVQPSVRSSAGREPWGMQPDASMWLPSPLQAPSAAELGPIQRCHWAARGRFPEGSKGPFSHQGCPSRSSSLQSQSQGDCAQVSGRSVALCLQEKCGLKPAACACHTGLWSPLHILR